MGARCGPGRLELPRPEGAGSVSKKEDFNGPNGNFAGEQEVLDPGMLGGCRFLLGKSTWMCSSVGI